MGGAGFEPATSAVTGAFGPPYGSGGPNRRSCLSLLCSPARKDAKDEHGQRLAVADAHSLLACSRRLNAAAIETRRMSGLFLGLLHGDAVTCSTYSEHPRAGIVPKGRWDHDLWL